MPSFQDNLKRQCQFLATFEKGVGYYKSKCVKITSDALDSNGDRLACAITVGNNALYRVSIRISADGARLLEHECSCPAHDKYNGPCKHVVALALQCHPSSPAAASSFPTTIRTDSEAVRMLRRYADKALVEVGMREGVRVAITPTLDYTTAVPSITFKIGADRMYVLKDLAEFCESMKSGRDIPYGKQFAFSPISCCFDEISARLAQFITTYYNGQTNCVFSNTYLYGATRNRNLFLPPYMLDEFISMYIGKELSVNSNAHANSFAVRTANPRLRLHIDKQENGGYLLRLTKSLRTMHGVSHLYLVCSAEKTIYMCDDGFSAATKDFFVALSKSSKHQLLIADADMPALSVTLLRELEPYLTVVSDAELSEFLPPPLQSRIYLDMPSPELITARLEFQYGDKVYPGFAKKDIRKSFDLRGETMIENRMARYFPSYDQTGKLLIREDENAVFALVDHGVAEFAEFAEVFVSDAFKAMRIKPPVTVSVGVRVESNLLRLHFDMQGVDLSELEEVLASYRKTKKYHRLRDGSFLALEGSTMSEFSRLAQGLDLTSKEIMSGTLSLNKYRALYLDSMLKQSEQIQYDRDSSFKKIIRDVRDINDADFSLPASLKPVLRNYQKTGYRWMRTLAAYGFGGILADDMGLGKTLQVIALLLAQKEEQRDHTVSLVICPSSLVFNWEHEVQKFAPALHVLAISGTLPEREAQLARAGEADLLVTSYDHLKRDIEQYTAFSFQYVVADEAQYMKNQNTQNAKSVKTLRAAARFALTGTPVENSLAEVWSVFDFLMPGYLYHYAKFRKNFEQPIVRQEDEDAAKNLRQMVSPFILRRMKRDVLKELPEKIETVLYAEFEEEQQKLYVASATLAKQAFEQGLGDSNTDKLQILALLTQLRQLCCDPALLYENYEAGSAKLELCIELLQSCIESNHRVLLFSQFTSMLDRIAARLDTMEIPYLTITGGTKVSQRLDLVNTFNEGTIPVFLISLKAGGTGLNLTGADVVIHYDPWWNSSAQNQATDRAHRIGQTKSVQVYKLIAKNTIEERILDMQKSKADLADLIVRAGDGAFAQMSKSEILALFE